VRRHRLKPLGTLRTRSRRTDEHGVIIVLVAVVMLFVVGAMAALSIDVVTLYTARSEAQLAADGAALAGARVLANSGMTSDPTADTDGVMSAAQNLAGPVAIQVAQSNAVGGRNLIAANGEVLVGFNGSSTNPCVTLAPVANPCISVKVQRTDLPTFFSRIWGRTQLTVGATATAEAYNPSTATTLTAGTKPPVAPMCVKPWILPNMDPTPAGTTLFNATTGTITNPALLGWVTPPGGVRLRNDCETGGGGATDCSANLPQAWRYYPGTTDPATGDFPAPNASSVVCTGCTGFDSYQLSVAGCVQPPITCNSVVHIDQTGTVTNALTKPPVDGLTHTNANEGDSVDAAAPVAGPFQFLTGADDPVVLSGAVAADSDIMVSDSLVTVPVIDTTNWPPTSTVFPAVQVIGFVRLFLNPSGAGVPGNNHIHTKVINMVGCGTTGTTGSPTILGNGASPVAVRLISGP
jgi:hypothetical protein